MNCLMSDCWPADGVSGYCAAIVWRRVQELRPRVSTSAGQSAGGPRAATGSVAVPVLAWSALLWEVNAANELHDRHLESVLVS